jgi:hypothetical protein
MTEIQKQIIAVLRQINSQNVSTLERMELKAKLVDLKKLASVITKHK